MESAGLDIAHMAVPVAQQEFVELVVAMPVQRGNSAPGPHVNAADYGGFICIEEGGVGSGS